MRWLRRTLATGCGLVLGLAGVAGSAWAGASEPGFFSSRVLATGFANPWEITWGPDSFLWVTEQNTGRVSRVRPSDGARTTVLEIAEVFHADAASQDGLLGMGRWIPRGRGDAVIDASTWRTPTTPTRARRRLPG